LENKAMTTNSHQVALTSVIDELHTLSALVGAAEQAAWDFSVGDKKDSAAIDRINRLMMVARERIAAAITMADIVPGRPAA
jgi:hypothetical protein